MVAPHRHCSFCWAPVASHEKQCGDCGHSVAEMDSMAAKRMAADRTWTPSRLRTEPGAAPAYRKRAPLLTVTTAPVGEPLPAPIPVRRQPPSVGVMVAGGAVFFAGAAGLGFWLALNTFPDRPASAAHSEGSAPIPAVTAPGPSVAQIRWSTEQPEVVFELETPDHKPVLSSRSTDPAGAGIQPGDYVLYAADRAGDWREPWQKVHLSAGERMELTPPSDLLARYQLWRGSRLHTRGDDADAEKAWREAIRLNPKLVEARLELAALLAVGFKYREARGEVAEALKVEPGNVDALKLSKTLKELEAAQ